ncbi:MAG: hypothetical protein ACAH59_00085 [Pseudobdellovibrionaceae bacterium]
MGHQLGFEFGKVHWKFRYTHGGILRQKRLGRGARPLSSRDPIHLVLKADRLGMRRGFRSPLAFSICERVLKRYSKKFFVKIEQKAICGDHLHLLIRITRRSLAQHFLRVVAGQIAQEFGKSNLLVTDTPHPTTGSRQAPTKTEEKKTKLWKFRPFTRIVKGWKAYLTVRNYIRLNEKEAKGEIKYSKQRLRGLSTADWQLLWT